MLIKIYGSAIFGVSAQTITIEVNIDTGGVGYHLVGLPDNAIKRKQLQNFCRSQKCRLQNSGEKKLPSIWLLQISEKKEQHMI